MTKPFLQGPRIIVSTSAQLCASPIIYQVINNWSNQRRDEFAKSSPPGRAVPQNGCVTILREVTKKAEKRERKRERRGVPLRKLEDPVLTNGPRG